VFAPLPCSRLRSNFRHALEAASHDKTVWCIWELKMATPRGFEPPISTVTGWHVGPLHHGAAMCYESILGIRRGGCQFRWEFMT
jgi:hypothetical protein